MIFVDTTFWVGDADSNDDFHSSAHVVIEAIRTGKTPAALTTDFVLDETVTILGRRRGFGAEKASKVAKSLLSSPRVYTVYVDEALFKESLRLYPTFGGALSLTDVSTVVAMRAYGSRRSSHTTGTSTESKAYEDEKEPRIADGHARWVAGQLESIWFFGLRHGYSS